MNVIWDCWEELSHRPNVPHVRNLSLGKGWEDVFIDCKHIQAASARKN